MFLAVVSGGQIWSLGSLWKEWNWLDPGKGAFGSSEHPQKRGELGRACPLGEVICFLSVAPELRTERVGGGLDCDLAKQEGVEGAPEGA